MQHRHSAPKIFSSLFKSPIVQSSQPKGRFGKIEQRCIDQCSMVAGHGLYTECQPDRPQGLHDFNWIIQTRIDLLYVRSKANQIFNCLIDQTDNVGIWLGIAERPAVSDAQFLDAITKPLR
jgi:hypothetical protein